MTVLLGPKIQTTLESLVEVNPDNFTMKNIESIIEIEAALERMFGYRFHIDLISNNNKMIWQQIKE